MKSFYKFTSVIFLGLFVSMVSGCGIFLAEDYRQINDPAAIGQVSFSEPSGFYSGLVTVSLSSGKPDDLIYYTLDGSAPTLEPYTITIAGYDGDDPIVDTYNGGILYSGPININATCLVRARVYRKGDICGKDSYGTYFIDEPTTLPVFSLAIEPVHLYDDYAGIYTAGNNPANPERPPYTDLSDPNENYFQDWERPVHLEYFDEAEILCLKMDAGVQIFGGWSRGFNQKSLAIFARGEYGLGVIPYKFFDNESITTFTSIILRNSGDDWYRTMFRDAMLQSLLTNMNVDRQAYKPAVVFINGRYWGIHNIREKVNEDYLASHYDYVRPDLLDILESYESTVVTGDNRDFLDLVQFVENNDMSLAANYAYVETKIDMDNFIDYMIAEIYFNNTDWPFSNIKYWRPRTVNGKWRWIIYDLDGCFRGKEWAGAINDFNHDTIAWTLAEDGNTDTATIFAALFNNNEFKNDFGTRFRELLDVDANFDPDIVKSKIDQMVNILNAPPINPEINRHIGRWPDSCGNSVAGWTAAVDVMKTFADDRYDYVTDPNPLIGMLAKYGL